MTGSWFPFNGSGGNSAEVLVMKAFQRHSGSFSPTPHGCVFFRFQRNQPKGIGQKESHQFFRGGEVFVCLLSSSCGCFANQSQLRCRFRKALKAEPSHGVGPWFWSSLKGMTKQGPVKKWIWTQLLRTESLV